MLRLFLALPLTILFESIVVLFMTRSWEWVKHNTICNLITNPSLNLFLIAEGFLFRNRFIYDICLISGEITVLFAEMFLYRAMTFGSKKQCFILSLITNLVSFFSGLAVFQLFGIT